MAVGRGPNLTMPILARINFFIIMTKLIFDLEVTVTSSPLLPHFHLEVTFKLEFLVGSEFMSER
jgi:hypothetical protein